MTGMTTSTSPGIAQRTTSFAAGAPRNGLLKKKAEDVAAAGRGGDTELAHVNPREKALLKRHGGSGTVNPKTGLREFMNEGGGGTGDGSGTNDSDVGASASSDADQGSAPGWVSGIKDTLSSVSPSAGEHSSMGGRMQANAQAEAQDATDDGAYNASKTAYQSWANENPIGAMLFGGFMGLAPGATAGKAAAGYASGHGVAMGMPSTGGRTGADPSQGDPGYVDPGGGTTSVAANYDTGGNGLIHRNASKPTPATHPNGAYQIDPQTGMVDWTPEE